MKIFGDGLSLMHFVTLAVQVRTAREKSFHIQLQKKREKKEVENLWQTGLAFQHKNHSREVFPQPRTGSSGEGLAP